MGIIRFHNVKKNLTSNFPDLRAFPPTMIADVMVESNRLDASRREINSGILTSLKG